MITGIEVSNFKGFRELKLSGLGRYHVLVGPNGSGKTTFFEIFGFVRDLLRFDIHEAISRRGVNSLRELTFDRRGGSLRIEIALDEALFDGKSVRYQLELEESGRSGATIASETLLAMSEKVVWRTGDSPVFYAREFGPSGDYFSFPWERSALSQVPPDENRYPIANRVRKLLAAGVQSFTLDSPDMGAPCPPRISVPELLPDGRNLARISGRMPEDNKEDWLYHVRLAIEDLDCILWRQQEDSRAEYLVLRYKDGLEIPGWLASFGTLRTLALTLPAFLPSDGTKLYLFEEPENGIHPKAIEIVMNAIHSIPYSQTFVTTHSPMVVQQCEIESLLLFSKKDRVITMQHGPDNTILREWDGVPDLATVVGSRVLG